MNGIQPLPHEIGGINKPANRRHERVASLRMRFNEIHLPDNRTSVVSVVGDVNWTTSGKLSAEINQLLTAEHPTRLILDLKGVTHIDSSGVGTLLEGLHGANQRHIRFTLAGLSGSLGRILQRMHLNTLFDIRPTVEEALQN